MKGVNLKAMTVDALIDLRGNIDRILSTKVAAARQELNSKLEKLNSFLGKAPDHEERSRQSIEVRKARRGRGGAQGRGG